MSTEHGSEGGEGDTSTEEPPVILCTWHPDEEDTAGPTVTADSSDVTLTAPTVFPLYSAMAASLPAARVSAVRPGGVPGTKCCCTF